MTVIKTKDNLGLINSRYTNLTTFNHLVSKVSSQHMQKVNYLLQKAMIDFKFITYKNGIDLTYSTQSKTFCKFFTTNMEILNTFISKLGNYEFFKLHDKVDYSANSFLYYTICFS
jgi:hypothetical protein